MVAERPRADKEIVNAIKSLRHEARYYYDTGMFNANSPKSNVSEVLARFDVLSQQAREQARKSEDEQRYNYHCNFVKICGDGLSLLVALGFKQRLADDEKQQASLFSRNAIVIIQKIQRSEFDPTPETLLACTTVANNTALLMPVYFYQEENFRKLAWGCHYGLKEADIALARQETNRVDRLVTTGFERGRISEEIADFLAHDLFLPEYRSELRLPTPFLKRPVS